VTPGAMVVLSLGHRAGATNWSEWSTSDSMASVAPLEFVTATCNVWAATSVRVW